MRTVERFERNAVDFDFVFPYFGRRDCEQQEKLSDKDKRWKKMENKKMENKDKRRQNPFGFCKTRKLYRWRGNSSQWKVFAFNMGWWVSLYLY